MLIPQTADIMTQPINISLPTNSDPPPDKYDQIYAKYSSVVDPIAMEVADDNGANNMSLMTKNMSGEQRKSSSSSGGDPFANLLATTISATAAVRINNNSNVSSNNPVDPPEEYKPYVPKTRMSSLSSSYPIARRSISGISGISYPDSEFTSSSPPNKQQLQQQQKQDYYNNTPTTTTTVASRDDDATILSSSQYSIRSSTGGGGGNTNNMMSSAASVSSHRSSANSITNNSITNSGGTREDIYSKLEVLNAKSRALRGITYTGAAAAVAPPPSSSSSIAASSYTGLLASSSPYSSPSTTGMMMSLTPSTSILSSTSYSPTSVMSMSVAPSSNSSNKYSSSSPSQNRQSTMSADESIDSRLDFLTKQSLALRNRTSTNTTATTTTTTTATTTASTSTTDAASIASGNRKVTFEEDYINGANIGMTMMNNMAEDDNKSVYSSLDERSSSVLGSSGGVLGSTNKKFLSRFNDTTTMATTSNNVATMSSAAASVTSTSSSFTKVVSTNNNNKNSSSLAMKILSEKILDGYTMTRNHCPACNMALLCKKRERYSTMVVAGSSNGGGTMIPATNMVEECCVYCPINTIRQSLSRGVCKRVMAAKLLSGFEVGSGTNSSGIDGGGKTTLLCDSCHSPSLINNHNHQDEQGFEGGGGAECQVCPVLDAACIEIVREQGRGGVLQDLTSCIDCGCPEMMYYNNGGGMMGTMGGMMGGMMNNNYSSSGMMGMGGMMKKCVICNVLKQMEEDCRYKQQQGLLALAQSLVSSPPCNGVSSSDARSVVGGSAMSVVSSDPTPTEPSVKKSNNNSSRRIDLAQLQSQIQAEFAKVKMLAPPSSSLEMPTLGCHQHHHQDGIVKSPSITSGGDHSGNNRPTSPEIVKSPSITSGDSPPPSLLPTTPPLVDLGRIEEQLKAVIAKAEKSQTSSSSIHGNNANKISTPVTLVTLKEQLKVELAMAKKSQMALERILHGSVGGGIGGGFNPTIASVNSTKSRDDLKAELIMAKQAQLALERIIAGTNNIREDGEEEEEEEETVTTTSRTPSDDNLDDLLAISQIKESRSRATTQSYSISQQEVDATGNLKEYITANDDSKNIFISPFFNHHHDTIPSVVIVYHIPEGNADDPSVAQSHHRKNLKRSENERYNNGRGGDACGVFDCGGDGAAAGAVSNKYVRRHSSDHPNRDRDHDNNVNYPDYDTIETDDDYTVDYTLNTMDDSRLDYLRGMQNKATHSMQDHRPYRGDDDDDNDDEMRHHERYDVNVPKSVVGRWLVSCFECGGGGGGTSEEDAYSMVDSRQRGIAVPHHQQRQQRQNSRRREGREPSSADERFRRDDSDRGYSSNQSMDDSEFGRMRRVGGAGRSKPPRGTTVSSRALYDRYSIDESDYGSMCRVSGGGGGGDGGRSSMIIHPKQQKRPSFSEWDSVNEYGSDYGSMCRVPSSPGSVGSPPTRHPPVAPLPKSSLRPPRSPTTTTLPRYRSDYSVQSDLTEEKFSRYDVNHRRVTFSSHGRGGRNQLQALAEERGSALDGSSSDKYSIGSEKGLDNHGTHRQY